MKKILLAKIVALNAIGIICAQTAYSQTPVNLTEEQKEQVVANKRRDELLRHPTFITLRLGSTPRDVPREDPTDTPTPYKIRDYIAFQLFITQNSAEEFTLWNTSSCFYCRPELTQDGEIVPYKQTVQKALDSQQPEDDYRGSKAPVTYEPRREYPFETIDLDRWYEPLSPGRYQLIVRRSSFGTVIGRFRIRFISKSYRESRLPFRHIQNNPRRTCRAKLP